jgi:hypothetical protein
MGASTNFPMGTLMVAEKLDVTEVLSSIGDL